MASWQKESATKSPSIVQAARRQIDRGLARDFRREIRKMREESIANAKVETKDVG